MNSKMIWANLAVTDLNRTTNFYTQLGFKLNGSSDELTSFRFGDTEFVINFFLREVLSRNTKVQLLDAQHSNEIIFTLAAASIREANDWAGEVEQAGGIIISAPEAFGKGYYGFVFADPDGHKFNVFYMEGLQ